MTELIPRRVLFDDPERTNARLSPDGSRLAFTVAALRERGIPHEYLLFEDEGHGFAKPENDLRFRTAAEAFLARHLGGRAEERS